jgi:hypothetical protein
VRRTRRHRFPGRREWISGFGPILSLPWHDVRGEEEASIWFGDQGNNLGLNPNLPAELRELVERGWGAGNQGDFKILTHLGAHSGRSLVRSETEVERAGPLRLERVAGFEAHVPEGVVKLSLAGVQLNFCGSTITGERLALPARVRAGRYILTAPAQHYPGWRKRS